MPYNRGEAKGERDGRQGTDSVTAATPGRALGHHDGVGQRVAPALAGQDEARPNA